MSDQARPPERTVQTTRAQMELARLLGVPFCADRESQDRAETSPEGAVIPELLDGQGAVISLYLRLPVETLQALVDVLRDHGPLPRRN